MKCVCVCFKEKKREETQTHPVAWGPLSWELRMKNTEKKIYSILAIIHLSLFIFQDLKEWRAKKKSRTICTLKVAFFVIDPAEEFDITV
jgi:hypothetical protein